MENVLFTQVTRPGRYLAAGFILLGLLMCGPSVAGERKEPNGQRDRQTTEWALPAQSMRDVAKEKASRREPEEKPLEEGKASTKPDEPSRCIKC